MKVVKLWIELGDVVFNVFLFRVWEWVRKGLLRNVV